MIIRQGDNVSQRVETALKVLGTEKKIELEGKGPATQKLLAVVEQIKRKHSVFQYNRLVGEEMPALVVTLSENKLELDGTTEQS